MEILQNQIIIQSLMILIVLEKELNTEIVYLYHMASVQDFNTYC